MYIKRHKYLSETNWRIHDESPTRSVNVLGLIPLVALSRHSSSDAHHERLWSGCPREDREGVIQKHPGAAAIRRESSPQKGRDVTQFFRFCFSAVTHGEQWWSSGGALVEHWWSTGGARSERRRCCCVLLSATWCLRAATSRS